MILITGATGKLGMAVIQNLLQRTPIDQVAALVRDESKAAGLKGKGVKLCVGNYDDIPLLDRAM